VADPGLRLLAGPVVDGTSEFRRKRASSGCMGSRGFFHGDRRSRDELGPIIAQPRRPRAAALLLHPDLPKRPATSASSIASSARWRPRGPDDIPQRSRSGNEHATMLHTLFDDLLKGRVDRSRDRSRRKEPCASDKDIHMGSEGMLRSRPALHPDTERSGDDAPVRRGLPNVARMSTVTRLRGPV